MGRGGPRTGGKTEMFRSLQAQEGKPQGREQAEVKISLGGRPLNAKVRDASRQKNRGSDAEYQNELKKRIQQTLEKRRKSGTPSLTAAFDKVQLHNSKKAPIKDEKETQGERSRFVFKNKPPEL